jgi:hypothetical protein
MLVESFHTQLVKLLVCQVLDGDGGFGGNSSLLKGKVCKNLRDPNILIPNNFTISH